MIELVDGWIFHPEHSNFVAPGGDGDEPFMAFWAEGSIEHPITGERLNGKLLFTANRFCNLEVEVCPSSATCSVAT